ncbi:MAG TPA: hypothetical protein VGB74_02810 [Actinoplanes sp.]
MLADLITALPQLALLTNTHHPSALAEALARPTQRLFRMAAAPRHPRAASSTTWTVRR